MAKNTKNQTKNPTLWSYLKKHKWYVFGYISFSVAYMICNIFTTLFVAQVLVKAAAAQYSEAVVYSLYTLLTFSLSAVLGWIPCKIYAKASNLITAELNLDIAKQSFKLNTKTFSDHGTGTFVQRIVGDPMRMVEKITQIFDNVIELIQDLIVFVYLISLNLWIGLICVGMIILAVILNYFQVQVQHREGRKVRREEDFVTSTTTEIVKSEKDIKSLGLEEPLSQISKKNYMRWGKQRSYSYLKIQGFEYINNWILQIIKIGMIIFALYLTDWQLMLPSTLLIIYTYKDYPNNLAQDIRYLSTQIADISVSQSRINQLFDETEYVTEKFGDKQLSIDGGAEIEFKDVSFSYKEYSYKQGKKKEPTTKTLISENQIFDKISFKIQRNTTVAFVGKSGSGKSTILDLMSKMYEVDAGQILIEGIDINELSKDALRKNISLVNQFPYIFDMTIKENLLIANPNATDEDITIALKKSSLDEFISTLPKGVDTNVGESGIKLSGGQKQRLAIARAMLRKSSLLIFDESTSSLDNFAQNNVKQSIDSLKGTSTIIIVAHRLSTIKNVDHIFYLDEGKIVDEGTFDELFERNPTFKTMFMAENI